MFSNKKTFQLSLNKNYVSRWGLAEAARELIQNALDSESPFSYEFRKSTEDESKTLVLRSEFSSLSPQSLLLGSTSKADGGSIGSFGEGYKIALLVLTRIGKLVQIMNGDKLWSPRFKFNSTFNDYLLVIEEEQLAFRHNGLTIELHGLDDEEVGAIVDSCLQMQDSIGEIKSTSYGDILLELAGKLFVGGLFICETNLKYGYNIKPEHIKLERDRQTVSAFDLKFVTKEMWFETKDYDLVAELIEEDIQDVEYAEHGSPDLVKEACYKLFKKKNPGAVAAKNQTELNELVERGMTKVVTVNSNMYSQVTRSASYRTQDFVAVEPIDKRLERWLSKNRSEMRTPAIVAFKRLIVESKNWKIK